jgi:hypothetical protein
MLFLRHIKLWDMWGILMAIYCIASLISLLLFTNYFKICYEFAICVIPRDIHKASEISKCQFV